MYEEVRNKVNGILMDFLGIPESEIRDEQSLTEDLGLDSLDLMDLILTVEEKFAIEIPEEDAKKLNTVKDVIIYVDAKVTK